MQKRFVFATGWPDAIGDLGKLDCTQYVGDNGLCIDRPQHTKAHDIVEEMCALQEADLGRFLIRSRNQRTNPNPDLIPDSESCVVESDLESEH